MLHNSDSTARIQARALCDAGIAALRTGNRDQARALLLQSVGSDPGLHNCRANLSITGTHRRVYNMLRVIKELSKGMRNV